MGYAGECNKRMVFFSERRKNSSLYTKHPEEWAEESNIQKVINTECVQQHVWVKLKPGFPLSVCRVSPRCLFGVPLFSPANLWLAVLYFAPCNEIPFQLFQKKKVRESIPKFARNVWFITGMQNIIMDSSRRLPAWEARLTFLLGFTNTRVWFISDAIKMINLLISMKTIGPSQPLMLEATRCLRWYDPVLHLQQIDPPVCANWPRQWPESPHLGHPAKSNPGKF